MSEDTSGTVVHRSIHSFTFIDQHKGEKPNFMLMYCQMCGCGVLYPGTFLLQHSLRNVKFLLFFSF